MVVFIHIHKTAGSTVRYILRSSFGLNHCDAEPWHARFTPAPFSANDLQRLRKVYPRLESIAGHRVTAYADLQPNGTELKYFTFLRDPVKMCASLFQFNVQKRGMTHLVFEDWIQDEWKHNRQTKMIAGTDSVDAAIRLIREKQIFVGLTECFAESMLLFKSLVAPPLDISYARVNVAHRNTLAESLLSTKRTRAMIVEFTRADVELYDFVRQELYPTYQQTYGPSLEADVRWYRESQTSFNRLNLNLSRLKSYLVYRPLLYLYRQGLKVQQPRQG
jgi:hypothetical protein